MGASYYNEHDQQKVAWLRELIRRGVVTDGEVDERSITDVGLDDLRGFSQHHFFAGIGAWSYALRLAGWPDDRPVWTGSCPCPSFSAAGKGAGFDDPRHLWPDWARLIGECQPATIFGEQADDAIGYGWLDLVQTDLERANYAVGKAVLGACSVGAPHIRQRLYFLGRRRDSEGGVAHAEHAERWPFNERRENGRNGTDSGRQEAHGEFGTCGEVRRMGESHGAGSQPGNSSATGNGHRSTDVAASGAGKLADANGRGFAVHGSAQREAGHTKRSGKSNVVEAISARLERHNGNGVDGNESRWFGARPDGSASEAGYVNGFWRDADWILRKRWNRDDWEWCPTEPGTFPLAHGAAARVLRLRGYGDAIVPQVAAAFIEAYLSL